MKLAVRLLLCLIALGMFVALRGYAFLLGSGSDNYAATVYTQYGATPTPTATATATIAATPTATPTAGGLPVAVTAMLGDVGNGATNPIPTLCAASGVTVPNGSASGGTCTTGGSVSVINIAHDGTDAGPALQAALNSGDVNLPAFTYTINTQINFPSWRTLQCQPGATITTTSTSINVLNFSSVGQSSVVGCTFTGNGGTASAIHQTGGQNINIIGNVFSGWTAGDAVVIASGTLDVIELNQFSNNGLSTSGGTHIMTAFNEQSGTLSPAIPTVVAAGGTNLQNHLWTMLNNLGASGTAATRGYSLVTPGSSFGGNTCTMNGSTNDTACIVSALAASTNGILVAPGTGGSPYVRIGTSDLLTGAQVNGKTILCEPGARFYYPGNSGTGGTPLHMFNVGFTGSGASNVNFVGCQMYGDYTDATVYINGGRYNEIIEIGANGGTSNVNGIGLDLEACYGDCWITYSPCGTNSTGSCSDVPSDSGPNDVALLFSKLYSSNQVAMHANGGQGVHNVFDSIGDADSGDEDDTNVLQVTTAEWDNIYFYSINGLLNNLNGIWRQPQNSCSDRQNVGANYGGCYNHDTLIDGSKTVSPGISGSGPWYPLGQIMLGVNVGCTPGTYSGMRAANGGTINGGGC